VTWTQAVFCRVNCCPGSARIEQALLRANSAGSTLSPTLEQLAADKSDWSSAEPALAKRAHERRDLQAAMGGIRRLPTRHSSAQRPLHDAAAIERRCLPGTSGQALWLEIGVS
jgi:hypothetical protein